MGNEPGNTLISKTKAKQAAESILKACRFKMSRMCQQFIKINNTATT